MNCKCLVISLNNLLLSDLHGNLEYAYNVRLKRNKADVDFGAMSG